ncbi:MAG: helix-turn-helix transcriptional regulator [Proteobacteria bacterium]|nr:helix-turn-helix transcriptional regulator [Pseudomonadota bacterium]
MSNRLWDKKHNTFRDTIKEIRNDRNLKQVELAKKLKKPQSFVSKYETGERKLDFVELSEICKVCDVSIEEFVKLYNSKL